MNVCLGLRSISLLKISSVGCVLGIAWPPVLCVDTTASCQRSKVLWPFRAFSLALPSQCNSITVSTFVTILSISSLVWFQISHSNQSNPTLTYFFPIVPSSLAKCMDDTKKQRFLNETFC
eukprot:TRINITY_DN3290_c0_g1_i7.p1 TRINITY_DN3290_c0_g1~~TRINITY_DN3290_c0_g1_i7.p1  ORF type:complete len:120 (-),score=4.95 TRINITY_DN3290_c0_g1_i7:272-631(-)